MLTLHVDLLTCIDILQHRSHSILSQVCHLYTTLKIYTT